MYAPEPEPTQMTRPLGADASFLDMIDPVMSGTLSTVAVTSRTKNSFRSAGARSSVGPMITPPTSRTAARNRSGEGVVS